VDLSGGLIGTLTSNHSTGVFIDDCQRPSWVIIVSIVILRKAYYVIDKVFNIPPEEARAWRKKIALATRGTIAPLLKNLLKYCLFSSRGWWCSVSWELTRRRSSLARASWSGRGLWSPDTGKDVIRVLSCSSKG